jgi:hypothetical protein
LINRPDIAKVHEWLGLAMIAVARTRAHHGGIYIAKFEAVKPRAPPLFSKLGTATEAFYELVPPVMGI